MEATPQLEERVRRDLESLRSALRREADLTLASFDSALRALESLDRRLAYGVMLDDNRIDALESRIDRLCQEFLVRHMPVAEQLRFVIAVMKVNSEIERIGDYAEAIARRTVVLPTGAELPGRGKLLEMGRLSYQILRQAVDAFMKGNHDLALATLDLDKQVDAMNKALHVELAHPKTGEQDLSQRFLLLEILNRIERVADRASNIAEETIYFVQGRVLRHSSRRGTHVLFLCDQNTCRSQIAEAIAKQRAPAHVLVKSAGWNARDGALDPGAAALLRARSLDIAGLKSKRLAELEPLDEFKVVVTLSQQAKEHRPPLAFHAIALEWEIPDPSKVKGTPGEIDAAYRAVFDELETKIGELLDSLAGPDADEGEEL